MLSREKIFDLAEPFGEFQYGDAQGDKRVAFARAVEAAAYERAAQECRVICSKNHADAATFKNGTKAYVQACDDCDDAIRALGEQHD